MYKKRGRKPKKPNKKIFEMLYYNPNMTAYEVADHFGVTLNTVYCWAYQFRKEKEA